MVDKSFNVKFLTHENVAPAYLARDVLDLEILQ